MGAFGVVLIPPLAEPFARVVQRQEPGRVQALCSKRCIKGLDVRVISGLSGS